MRLSKLHGLAAIAAMVVMASIGTSSAAAEGPTAFCEKHEDPCEAANVYVGHVAAVAENPRFLTGETSIVCKKSQLLGFNLGLGNPLTIHLQLLNFTEDCLATGGFGCEVNTTELGLLLLLRTALNLATVQTHGIKILVNCPGTGIHCGYTGLWGPLHALGSPNGESLAEIRAEEIPLEQTGLFCPEETKFDALYRLVLPDPIAITG